MKPEITVSLECLSWGNQSGLIFVAAIQLNYVKFQKSFERHLFFLIPAGEFSVKDIKSHCLCFVSLSDPLAASMSGQSK